MKEEVVIPFGLFQQFHALFHAFLPRALQQTAVLDGKK